MEKVLSKEKTSKEKDKLKASLKEMEITLAELRMQVSSVAKLNSDDFEKDLKIMEHEIHNKYIEEIQMNEKITNKL